MTITIHTSTSRNISPQPSSAKNYGSTIKVNCSSYVICKVKGSEKNENKLETIEEKKKQIKLFFHVPMLT